MILRVKGTLMQILKSPYMFLLIYHHTGGTLTGSTLLYQRDRAVNYHSVHVNVIRWN